MKDKKSEYTKAYGEVLSILKQLEDEDFNKIPPKLVKLFEEKRDKKWHSKISFEQSLLEQNLLEETKAILAVIYRFYLSESPMEKYAIGK